MRHKCDDMPDYVELEKYKNEWTFRHLDGTTVKVSYCPFCSKKLDTENYAKKSAALVLSSHLDISEQGAEYIVDLIIEATKHELTRKEQSNE